MLRCKICGFTSIGRATMLSHIRTMHRSSSTASTGYITNSESIDESSYFTSSFDDAPTYTPSESFSGGGGSFGGGGASGGWDSGDSSSSSSSCDSGSCGD